jgi:hemerythrin-like metal-binding protein
MRTRDASHAGRFDVHQDALVVRTCSYAFTVHFNLQHIRRIGNFSAVEAVHALQPLLGVCYVRQERVVKDLVWGKILSVGVDEIDEDHRKLIHIFNILNRSVMEGESPEYLAATLEELINCTVWHFSHEERLMLKHRYKEIEEHKAEHRDLIQSAKDLQQEILRADKPVADENIEFLERWLTEHILTTDGRLGSYLSQVM